MATAPVTGNSNATVMQQLGGITKQAGLSAVRELATPLNPLLSWFEGGHNLRFTAANQIGAAVSSNRAAVSSIAQLPLKSPPCKSCPAKVGGLCKCARKKFGV
ncbi:hypothetical protein [Ferrimonas senticii]|uniref:hypothetical protein n=1 Tax=Ferrimonas senticii TaxID=394566 RepID=UPI001969C763|nr:hypothetical protein [Ferrimonas senticii]